MTLGVPGNLTDTVGTYPILGGIREFTRYSGISGYLPDMLGVPGYLADSLGVPEYLADTLGVPEYLADTPGVPVYLSEY